MFHPLRASIQIKFAGGVVCSTADTMEGERSGGSEFRFRSGRPAAARMDRFYGKQSTFLIWRISLHILCALASGPSPAPAPPYAISAAASLSLTARGKPDALVSRPNRTRIHMDMSEPQSHCGGIRGRCLRDHLHMHVHDLVSDPSDT